MKKYGSIGINNEGGQQVPNIHDHETPRINNMVDPEQDREGDGVGKGIIIESAARTDGTPAMSSDSEWYNNFEKFGGNSFVSPEDNSAVGKLGYARRRCNAPLWVSLAIMVMLIGSYYLHIHKSTHDDIIKTTHASTDNGFSDPPVPKSVNVEPDDSTDNGGVGVNIDGSHPASGTDMPTNKSHASVQITDKDAGFPVGDKGKAKCSSHLECKSLSLKGDCCPTKSGDFLNCCGP